MQFNSLYYLIFLFAVAVVCLSGLHRFRWLGLLSASYMFYAFWNPFYLILILLSTAVDYCTGRALGHYSSPTIRKTLLCISLTLNLGLLITFKYFNFFSETWALMAGTLQGQSANPYHLDVLLPVGISFYTFQTMGYTIDVYRGLCSPERHAGRFALYVAFFPQLVAGPIERASQLLPQLSQSPGWDYPRAVSGLRLILWGLFKKMVIADRLALVVDTVYSDGPTPGGFLVVIATVAFAFQIYGDFSAYSDIAVGSARLLGIQLMLNFNRPYTAQTFQDFWRRWHISLSTWFRDYCFIPLGGSQRGGLRWARNILIVFLLSGLWHGANWTFVCWGALHALYYFVGEALSKRLGSHKKKEPKWLAQTVRCGTVFTLVCFAWIFFRADSIGHAWTLVLAIPTGWMHLGEQWHLLTATVPAVQLGLSLLALTTLFVLEACQEPNEAPAPYQSSRGIIRWAAYVTTLFAIYALGAYVEIPFLYFQF